MQGGPDPLTARHFKRAHVHADCICSDDRAGLDHRPWVRVTAGQRRPDGRRSPRVMPACRAVLGSGADAEHIGAWLHGQFIVMTTARCRTAAAWQLFREHILSVWHADADAGRC
jgi:hypothetical protein